MIRSLTTNIGRYALIISFFEGRMFSRWIVTNITSARGTLHCRKTRIPCGVKLVICGQYGELESKEEEIVVSVTFSWKA
jgi:hypothetical protein